LVDVAIVPLIAEARRRSSGLRPAPSTTLCTRPPAHWISSGFTHRPVLSILTAKTFSESVPIRLAYFREETAISPCMTWQIWL